MKTKLILLLVSFFTALSCASKKRVIKTEKTIQKQKEVVTIDSVVTYVKSLPINDTLFVGLGTNNIIADSVIKVRLNNFYTSKSSGKNRFIVTYDTIKKGLKIIASVSASDSTYMKVKEKSTKENLFIKKRDESRTIKRGFSWWAYLLVFVLVTGSVYYLYRKVF